MVTLILLVLAALYVPSSILVWVFLPFAIVGVILALLGILYFLAGFHDPWK